MYVYDLSLYIYIYTYIDTCIWAPQGRPEEPSGVDAPAGL